MANYTHARIAFDQAMGRTLEVNHISMQEAVAGQVQRESFLPPNVGAPQKHGSGADEVHARCVAASARLALLATAVPRRTAVHGRPAAGHDSDPRLRGADRRRPSA